MEASTNKAQQLQEAYDSLTAAISSTAAYAKAKAQDQQTKLAGDAAEAVSRLVEAREAVKKTAGEQAGRLDR